MHDALDDQLEFDWETRGFVVRLVNNLLLRFSTPGLMRQLFTRGAPRRLTAPKKTVSPTLLGTPSLGGSSPSLLSGFTTAPVDRKEEEQEESELTLSPEEFEAMLKDTPEDIRSDVLKERKDEYGEYLRRLEKLRREAVARLASLDRQILKAVEERKGIEARLGAPETEEQRKATERAEGSEEQSEVVDDRNESEGSLEEEQEDARRLRRLGGALRGHYGGITALDSAAGLVASGSLDTHVRVWDAETLECRHTIQGHSDIIRQVQFHERFLLTASNDSRIRMWDLTLLDSVRPRPSTMVMREEYIGGDEEETRMSLQSSTPPMSPSLCCTPVPPLELCCETAFVGHSDAVTCFQASGNTLLSGSADGTVREWDLATGAVRQAIDIGWTTGAQRRAPGPGADKRGTENGDGGFVGALQFYEFALATGTSDGVLRLWDLRTGQAHRQLGSGAGICSLRFDERTVVTGAVDGTAQLWDLRTGRVLQKLRFDNAVSSVQLAESQSHVAYAAECWFAARDSELHRYRANAMEHQTFASDFGVFNGRDERTQALDISSGTAAITRIHRQNDVLVSGDSEGIVKIWTI
ncbi:Mitochondrial fission protein [Coemansia sp. RSA 552]|nr:Mitochondrial fission protein [Coemansia sp. RSA 552]